MAEGDVFIYQSAMANLAKSHDYIVDNVKLAMLMSHTLDQTDEFFSEVEADEASDASYTDGGELLASKAINVTPANSWATTWAATTAYAVNDIVRPTSGNGYVYKCVTAGTSNGSEPTWSTTPLDQVADNTVEWVVFGRSVMAFDAADRQFANLNIGTPSHTVAYVSTGTSSTSPLLCAIELGVTASNGANYTVNFNADGMFVVGIF